jgi:uncharacterized membrane protein
VTSIPLHPALVHLPLGLAFLLPALAIGLSWALWKGKIRQRTWLIVVVLEAVLLGAGFAALKTGQQEEERVDSAVPETALKRHETLAEQFLWVTGFTLAVAAAVLATRRPGAIQALTATTVLGSLLAAWAALRVGQAGGQLVYVHNAGAVYAVAGKAKAQAIAPPKPRGQSPALPTKMTINFPNHLEL